MRPLGDAEEGWTNVSMRAFPGSLGAQKSAPPRRALHVAPNPVRTCAKNGVSGAERPVLARSLTTIGATREPHDKAESWNPKEPESLWKLSLQGYVRGGEAPWMGWSICVARKANLPLDAPHSTTSSVRLSRETHQLGPPTTGDARQLSEGSRSRLCERFGGLLCFAPERPEAKSEGSSGAEVVDDNAWPHKE